MFLKGFLSIGTNRKPHGSLSDADYVQTQSLSKQLFTFSMYSKYEVVSY